MLAFVSLLPLALIAQGSSGPMSLAVGPWLLCDRAPMSAPLPERHLLAPEPTVEAAKPKKSVEARQCLNPIEPGCAVAALPNPVAVEPPAEARVIRSPAPVSLRPISFVSLVWFSYRDNIRDGFEPPIFEPPRALLAA